MVAGCARRGYTVMGDMVGEGVLVWLFLHRGKFPGEVAPGECYCCGGPPAAFGGNGHPSVSVCPTCALEKLPLLIADAVAAGGPPAVSIDRFEVALPSIVGAYWRGVAHARLPAKADPLLPAN